MCVYCLYRPENTTSQTCCYLLFEMYLPIRKTLSHLLRLINQVKPFSSIMMMRMYRIYRLIYVRIYLISSNVICFDSYPHTLVLAPHTINVFIIIIIIVMMTIMTKSDQIKECNPVYVNEGVSRLNIQTWLVSHRLCSIKQLTIGNKGNRVSCFALFCSFVS